MKIDFFRAFKVLKASTCLNPLILASRAPPGLDPRSRVRGLSTFQRAGDSEALLSISSFEYVVILYDFIMILSCGHPLWPIET